MGRREGYNPEDEDGDIIIKPATYVGAKGIDWNQPHMLLLLSHLDPTSKCQPLL